MRVVGVDVGARRLHAVALDDAAAVVDVGVFDAAEPGELVDWADGAAAVAVDSPDRWSTAPHAADEGLSPKFRTARCSEIGLGRQHGIWVPWTTPVDPRPGTWIDVGIALFGALRAGGHEPLEVYPYGAFRVLNRNQPPPSKQTLPGSRSRV